MKTIKSIIERVQNTNKYLLTIILVGFWVLFFDRHNIIEQFQELQKINELEETRDYYREKIKVDSAQLHNLKTSRENLEKFAREKYLMKKTDEEIYVIEYMEEP